MENYVIELAKVLKKTGVSDADFKKAIESLDDFVGKQDGFISREGGYDEKGFWIDVVKWESLLLAKLAADNAMNSELCLKAFGAFDEQNLEMNHVIVRHLCIPADDPNN